jgi:hypothetical protein
MRIGQGEFGRPRAGLQRPLRLARGDKIGGSLMHHRDDLGRSFLAFEISLEGVKFVLKQHVVLRNLSAIAPCDRFIHLPMRR